MSTSAQRRRPPRVSTIGRLLKAAGAAIGAAVILGMGAFSVTVTDSAVIATGPHTGGQTITQTAPPREPETPFAKPTMTAPPKVGQPLAKNPYPQVNPFPELPKNPWS